MARMLFVHGVNTRESPEYDVDVENRNRRFKEVVFDGNLSVENAYWGDFGARPSWNLQCIPDLERTVERLSGNGQIDTSCPDPVALLSAARIDFSSVVSTLSDQSLREADHSDDPMTKNEQEEFWRAAARYALKSPQPSWLNRVTDDEEFLSALQEQVKADQKVQGLGALDWLNQVGASIAGLVSKTINTPAARMARDKISPMVAIFIGDVFEYLKSGERRENIREAVLNCLLSVAQAESGSLVVMGHSMGGVILYDLLSDADAMNELEGELKKPLKIDLFATVGSQVALFEELKLFTSSEEAYRGSNQPPHNRVPKPKCIERWWNIYNRLDVLSFLATPVFDYAKDFAIDTMAGVRSAHSAYFTNMLFYERLASRVRDEGLA